MISWFSIHPWALPMIMFLINTIVSNLPDPDNTSGKGYKFLYGSLHGIVGGIGNVIFAAKPPSQLPAPITTSGGEMPPSVDTTKP